MRYLVGLSAVSALALGLQISTAKAQSMGQGYNPPPPMAATSPTPGIRPGNDIGTRESLPLSPNASNIASNDSGSTIAPTPPLPNVPPGATVQQLLMAARQALASSQTGMAQEAMERAETRLLDRSVLASQTNYTNENPMVSQIENSRQMLGAGDIPASMQIIDQVLASGSPQLAE